MKNGTTKTNWELAVTPTLWSDMARVPGKMARQIMRKIDSLQTNPHPDGHTKRKVKSSRKNPIYRIRAGDHRLFYTFGKGWIRLLALRQHHEGYEDPTITYKEPGQADLNGELHDQCCLESFDSPGTHQSKKEETTTPPKEALITHDMLVKLEIPARYHCKFESCYSEERFCEIAETLPPHLGDRLLQALCPSDISTSLTEPDQVLSSSDDLIRFVEQRDFKALLLRLDEDQKRLVNPTARGPLLIKGGPGTGKSILAVYKIQSILNSAKEELTEPPRILFTTFTNTLICYANQLLEKLLSARFRDDIVTVDTAHRLVRGMVEASRGLNERIIDSELVGAFRAYLRSAGNPLVSIVDRLGVEYVLDEFKWVIEGQALGSLDEYRKADRKGRRVGLTDQARESIFGLFEGFRKFLQSKRLCTWEQVWSMAMSDLENGRIKNTFDWVLIDEAQDLPQVALRFLVSLSRSREGLVLTADVGQSIYARGVRWKRTHEWLKFRGRTAVLRKNYRTTQQIAVAAAEFLGPGLADTDCINQVCTANGKKPELRGYDNTTQMIEMAAEVLQEQSTELSIPVSLGAILVRHNEMGHVVAEELCSKGVPAQFMRRQELDLEAKAVKVLTIHSAKGLEFPIVVLLGLEDGVFPSLRETKDEQKIEEIDRERRLMYVGMTRAMHSLVVLYSRPRPSMFVPELAPDSWIRKDL